MVPLHPERLRCERLSDPLAVAEPRPRLSWIVRGDGRGQRQTAYRVTVAGSRDELLAARGLLWDSGRVAGDTLHADYDGLPLAPGQRVWWRVMVWDRDGVVGPASAPARWGAALATTPWPADWIGHGHPWSPAQPPSGDDLDPLANAELTAALLRTSFPIDRPVARATAYATARGVYRLQLNGRRVGSEELAPGWTDYRQRIHYQAHDVTDHLRAGENALGVLLGEGWYAGFVGFSTKQRGAHYGNRPSVLVQLRIEFEDGTVTTVGSGPEWRTSDGPIVASDLQMGERYDVRREQPGWDGPGFDDTDWAPAVLHEPTEAKLEPEPCEPIRKVQELAPVAVSEPRPGHHVFDLGQNLVGWARLRIPSPADDPTPDGTTVRLRFAEALEPDGTLYTENLRGAQACDVVHLRGGEPHVFEPHFTSHGFRYVEVTGLPRTPAAEDLTACVLHTDARWSGSFACSDPLLNQLQSNVEWGQRGNFVGLPTDCPQRDERLGWLADAQVFCRTACLNMDLSAFFPRWLQDVRDAQTADGIFPDVAPLPPRQDSLSHGAPGWADAGVIVPWLVWSAYGDERVLARSFASIDAWLAHLERENPTYVRDAARHNDYGDWLNVGADTPRDLLATAYWALDVGLAARIADVLGRDADAARYRAVGARIAAAFVDRFVRPDGSLRTPTQTGYLLALHAELLPESLRPEAVARLVADIGEHGGRLTTGFLGVGLLCPVLTEHGHAELAYDLALQEQYPSWGYTIRHGATTMWERWDGWTAEHGFQSPNMNSFNHYAFGAVGEWLHRHVAGLDVEPDVAGHAQLLIRPHVDERLAWARASYDGVRGPTAAGWRHERDRLTIEVSVPPSSTATVLVPLDDPALLLEGGMPAETVPGVTVTGVRDGRTAVAIGSGQYRFSAPWPAGPPQARECTPIGAAASTTLEDPRGDD